MSKNTLENLSKTFKKTIGFYFPGYIVLLSSSNENALVIGPENINNLTKILSTEPEIKSLFYNEFHLLSHLLFSKIDNNLKNDIKKYIAGFPDNNAVFLDLLVKNNSNMYFSATMQNQLFANNYFLSEIKKSELFELNKDYENESAELVKLRMQADYREDLRKYISNILSYKEDYYYNSALNFEKKKKWDEARKLYKSILTINKNNFEANYRLGMLSLILQDLDSAFLYLQYAMQLKRDNPKVFYQMGVLIISRGNPREALGYFEKALGLNEKTASLLYYMGLCYEEMDNLVTALNYYNQAQILDQNDKNIKSGIDRIKEKNTVLQNEQKQDDENDQNSHTEVEKGENMPMPVTENALNYRVNEEKPKTDKNTVKEKK